MPCRLILAGQRRRLNACIGFHQYIIIKILSFSGKDFLIYTYFKDHEPGYYSHL